MPAAIPPPSIPTGLHHSAQRRPMPVVVSRPSPAAGSGGVPPPLPIILSFIILPTPVAIWPSILKGLKSFSPGLARFREGLPWVVPFNITTLEGLNLQSLGRQIQPLQGCNFSVFSPRVARGAQPWAERCNPFGIDEGVLVTHC